MKRKKNCIYPPGDSSPIDTVKSGGGGDTSPVNNKKKKKCPRFKFTDDFMPRGTFFVDKRSRVYNWVLKHTLFRGHHPNAAIQAMLYYDLTRRRNPTVVANACAWLSCKVHREMGERGGKETPVRKTASGEWIFWNNCRMFSREIHKEKYYDVGTMVSMEKRLLKYLNYRCNRETVYTIAYWKYLIPYTKKKFGVTEIEDSPLRNVHTMLCALCVISMFVFKDTDHTKMAKILWKRTLTISKVMGWIHNIPETQGDPNATRVLNQSIAYAIQNGLYRPIIAQIVRPK